MTSDLDSLLRRAAERDRGAPLDRQRIWQRVLDLNAAVHVRRRRFIRLTAIAACLAVAILATAMWTNIGTRDFALVPMHHRNPAGHVVFESRDHSHAFSSSDSTHSDADHQRLGEELMAKSESGEYRLTRVVGMTIHGRTQLMGLAEFQTQFGPKISNLTVRTSFAPKPTEPEAAEACRFEVAHLKQVIEDWKRGQGQPLDPVEFTTDGLRVRCERRSFWFPDFGTVIYWDGKPLP